MAHDSEGQKPAFYGSFQTKRNKNGNYLNSLEGSYINTLSVNAAPSLTSRTDPIDITDTFVKPQVSETGLGMKMKDSNFLGSHDRLPPPLKINKLH